MSIRAPFPWFGGKSRAAHLVWEALGDVANYVEPFAGSCDGGAGGGVGMRCAKPSAVRASTIARRLFSTTERPRSIRVTVAGDTFARAAMRYRGDPDSGAVDRCIVSPLRCVAWCRRRGRNVHPSQAGNSGARNRPASNGLESLAILALVRPAQRAEGLAAQGRAFRAVGTDHVDVESVEGWMHALAARLRAVRVACGDWRRVVASPSVLFPAGRRDPCGVYLDPPYAEGAADYAVGGTGSSLSAEVRAWCEEHDRNPRVRIVLSGYEGEHDALQRRGWRVVEWRTKGGYSNAGGNNVNRHRERLWLSPHCVGARQPGLFDARRAQ